MPNALRLWFKHWCSSRVTLHVHSDNVTSLYMVIKMQPKTPALLRVAHEIALDITQAMYDPDVAAHVAGINHGIADWLSRPSLQKSTHRPAPIAHLDIEVPPPRTHSFWKAQVDYISRQCKH